MKSNRRRRKMRCRAEQKEQLEHGEEQEDEQ